MKIKIFQIFNIALVLSYILISLKLDAQNTKPDSKYSKFYMKASLGEGFAVNEEFYNYYNNNSTENAIRSQLGLGFNYTAAVGYRYNSNLAAEIGLNYFDGGRDNLYPAIDDITYSRTAKMSQITPSVVYSETFGKFIPYIRVGLDLAMPVVYEENFLTIPVNSNFETGDVLRKYNKGLATGIQSSIGCSFRTHKKISLFAEVVFNDIGYIPKESDVYYYTVNGADQLYMVPLWEKQVLFKKTGPYFISYPPSADQPSILSERKILLSSLIFNIGVKLDLGKDQSSSESTDQKHHFYMRLNVGFGLPANGDILNNFNKSFDTASAVQYSGGMGLNIGIGSGYMITKNIGFDLGLNYVSSSRFSGSENGYRNPNVNVNPLSSSQGGNMFQINPSVVFSTNINKFMPYARLGLLIGFGTVNVDYKEGLDSTGTLYPAQQTWKYYGGISVGYNSVLGISYPINDKLDAFVEASFNSIYDEPEKAVMTKDVYNGADILGSVYTDQKQLIFKSSYNDTHNSDPNSPTISTPVRFSFNATVVSIGLKYWLK